MKELRGRVEMYLWEWRGSPHHDPVVHEFWEEIEEKAREEVTEELYDRGELREEVEEELRQQLLADPDWLKEVVAEAAAAATPAPDRRQEAQAILQEVHVHLVDLEREVIELRPRAAVQEVQDHLRRIGLVLDRLRVALQ
jgi:hypothetical protein